MDERTFHLRSRAQHEGAENDLTSLDFEIEIDGEWQPVTLALTTQPFRALVCASLMCQHAYLRMNATERGLLVYAARAEFWMKTEDWHVREITAHFELTMQSGDPSADDLAFICERMRDCPISRNLQNAEKTTTLEVVAKAL